MKKDYIKIAKETLFISFFAGVIISFIIWLCFNNEISLGETFFKIFKELDISYALRILFPFLVIIIGMIKCGEYEINNDKNYIKYLEALDEEYDIEKSIIEKIKKSKKKFGELDNKEKIILTYYLSKNDSGYKKRTKLTDCLLVFPLIFLIVLFVILLYFKNGGILQFYSIMTNPLFICTLIIYYVILCAKIVFSNYKEVKRYYEELKKE